MVSRAFSHEVGAEAAQSDKTRNSKNANNDSHVNIVKRYLVYMELPKIKIGDYHKSSCVVGNILRFHFLLKIANNENETLRLLPIKAYKVPVVNVAVIHRPFIDDETAKGPIPKSPGVKSPLLRYSEENDEENLQSQSDSREEMDDRGNGEGTLEEDFRKGSADAERRQQEEAEKQREYEMRQREQRESERLRQQESERLRQHESERQKQSSGGRSRSTDNEDQRSRESEDASGRRRSRDGSKHRHGGGKKRKKYFVYCELPKVAIGDYRISSVTSSELIHCHFLVKIAKDEKYGQPVLRPIKKYKRPRVNFAVIHRALIVDDEAAGPIPRSPGVKSPMIREDADGDDDDEEVLHANLGFNYGGAQRRTKYGLLSQWSLVADERGRIVPELVLSKAIG